MEQRETVEKALFSSAVGKPLLGVLLSWWADYRLRFSGLSRADKAAHLFWLAGPFLLLIERTPADIWLTVIGVWFLVRSFVNSDFSWTQLTWVRAAFIFLGCSIISGVLSVNPSHSLTEALIWFRFPLFAIATVCWLGRDEKLVYAMYGALGIGMLIMCGILSAELMIEGQKQGRLAWPYGDLVPGSYLAKACMPAFLLVVALISAVPLRLASLFGITVIGNLIISLATGERINLLLRLCAAGLATFVWRPRLSRSLFIVGFAVGSVALALMIYPHLMVRFVSSFVDSLPGSSQSMFTGFILSSLQMWKTAPIFGVGVDMYRQNCVAIETLVAGALCDNHPHNFYLQFLVETGVVGLVSGTFMFGTMLWPLIALALRSPDNAIARTSWIVALAFFWPVTTTADFFGQWNNLFMWSGLALAMASVNFGGSATPYLKAS